jgi:glutamate racemase
VHRLGAPGADGAVGFFDSGLGGLCILDAFKRLCPDESTVYIADSANCPYGNRPAEEIVRISRRNTARLLGRGCKMVVVACNTATAAAIDVLRADHPEIPFIGIEPAVKPAALRSRTGVVGVLATAGTFDGRLYRETKAKFAKDVTVVATVADEFVEMVERGVVPAGASVPRSPGRAADLDRQAEETVRARIEPLLKAGCDKIVLGCTHFPHLKPVIEKVCAGRAEVIDPSDAVARQAKRVLAGLGLSASPGTPPTHVFVRTRA